MKIGLGIGIPFIRNYVSSIVFDPGKLFTGNTNGAWYDPSDLTTLYRDAAGTQPVTAVEQPVGLMLDKRDTAYSTYFDGSGDYLSTPDSTGLNLSSGDFTIECWIYPQRSNIKVINKGGVNGTYYPDYELNYSSTGKINFGLGGGASVWQIYSGTSSVSQNAWTHVAIVRSGNSIKSYIDGVVDIDSTYTKTAVNNARDLKIGFQTNDSSELNWLGYISNLRVVKGTALYTANFTPPTAPLTAVAGTSLLTCGTSWSGNPAITSNGNTRADKLNPFTTGTGNHAFNGSGNSANFPVLSARVNLLTKTEQFDDAVWTKSQTTAPSVSVTNPIGGALANKLTEDTTNAIHSVGQYISASAGSCKITVYAKQAGRQRLVFVLQDSSKNNGCYAVINLNTVNVDVDATLFGAGFNNGSASATSVGNGWVLCTLTATVPATTIGLSCQLDNATSGPLSQGYLGNGTDGIYIWGADLRVANDALNQPAYQRVNTATDYDTVGFKPYLRFNGTNQWLQTNSIDFTYGDKMFVSAGVRKLSDAAAGSFLEFGNSGGIWQSGSFGWTAPSAATNKDYQFVSRGVSALTAPTTPASYQAPITNVVSSESSPASASSYVRGRVNGVQVTSSATDQGGGNYGNYPLYIGARAGSSLWFNGRLYQMVVTGKQASAAEITSTETYLNQKTGAF